MPVIATKAAASAQGFGEFSASSGPTNYIEDVFSTYLYKGNSSTQTINNGVDLAGKGGMVWLKVRDAGGDNYIRDTARGGDKILVTNSTNATGVTDSYPDGNGLRFDATGFSLGPGGAQNSSLFNYASWTFRKQPKFFDVVTWTSNGFSNQEVNHSLGAVPGFIVYKKTSIAGDWTVLALNSSGTYYNLKLNSTAASPIAPITVTAAKLTSTTFNANAVVGSAPGTEWVAYLFAHNAGGFGLTGTDNVISCGSCFGGSGTTVNLGYEPQWLLIKKTNAAQDWFLMDNMRGLNANQGDMALSPNTSAAEPTASSNFNITSTGFVNAGLGTSTDTYIYIAIRRGPMKVPTDGTKVFRTGFRGEPEASAQTSEFFAGFPIDWGIYRNKTISENFNRSRLAGDTQYLSTNSSAAELSDGGVWFQSNTTFHQNVSYSLDSNRFAWMFRRAPGFFDQVCYTGDGVSRNINHNLGVAPELWVIKARSTIVSWHVGGSLFSSPANDYLILNTTDAKASLTNFWNAPTSTTFGFGTGLPAAGAINASGQTYVAYLFASAPGVSKVGSYTGTGTTQTINCGFTGGARFVLIKRTDSTGDWVLWDSSRGMVAGTDPRLALNSTAAEVNQNWVYTTTGGFQIVTSDAAVNASGGSYIYLSIA